MERRCKAPERELNIGVLQSSQVVALPAAIQSGNVALQGLGEGVEVETGGSGTSINSLHKPGMGLLTGMMEYRWFPRASGGRCPCPRWGLEQDGLKGPFLYKPFCDLWEAEPLGAPEHQFPPSQKWPASTRKAISHGAGSKRKGKKFSAPWSQQEGGGRNDSLTEHDQSRVSRALTFQGSFGAGSLGSLSSPATGSRVEPCCRAATCMGTGTQQWDTAAAEASPAAARAAPASCQSPACAWGGTGGSR